MLIPSKVNKTCFNTNQVFLLQLTIQKKFLVGTYILNQMNA